MKRAFPWLILLASAVVLAVLYPGFPARWPIHWGATGQIDGWTDKSPLAAGFPLLMGAALSMVLELGGWAAGRIRSGEMPAPWPERLAAANRNYLAVLASVLNLFFGYLACALPAGPPGLVAPVLLVLGAIAYPLYDSLRLSREMRAQGVLAKGYRGVFYSNPDDARLWVPKAIGYGLTLNFAHARARWLMAGLLLLPISTLLVLGSLPRG